VDVKKCYGDGFKLKRQKKDPDFAPLKVFDIIGYGKTATSPVEAVPLKYLSPNDKHNE